MVGTRGVDEETVGRILEYAELLPGLFRHLIAGEISDAVVFRV